MGQTGGGILETGSAKPRRIRADTPCTVCARAAVIIFVPLGPFCRPVYLRVWELQMKVAAAVGIGMLVCPVVVLRLSRDPDSVQTQGDP